LESVPVGDKIIPSYREITAPTDKIIPQLGESTPSNGEPAASGGGRSEPDGESAASNRAARRGSQSYGLFILMFKISYTNLLAQSLLPVFCPGWDIKKHNTKEPQL
jgi:hypothetical protein